MLDNLSNKLEANPHSHEPDSEGDVLATTIDEVIDRIDAGPQFDEFGVLAEILNGVTNEITAVIEAPRSAGLWIKLLARQMSSPQQALRMRAASMLREVRVREVTVDAWPLLLMDVDAEVVSEARQSLAFALSHEKLDSTTGLSIIKAAEQPQDVSGPSTA